MIKLQVNEICPTDFIWISGKLHYVIGNKRSNLMCRIDFGCGGYITLEADYIVDIQFSYFNHDPKMCATCSSVVKFPLSELHNHYS